MAHVELKKRKRSDYGYMLEYRTRWSDNDMYDHMNNSIYNHLFDSLVNSYLSTHCSIHAPTSPQYGLVVHSHTDFFSSIAFPAVTELCLRVNKLGKSSVTYEVALFEKGAEEVKAVGELVHVFVERGTGKPGVEGMGGVLREGLVRLSDGGKAKL